MKEFQRSVNSVETDFKSEVVAAALIESGQDAERLLLVRHKGNRKEVSKDIDRIEKQYADDGSEELTEYFYLYANRENIYDSLPEGLFHQPADSRKLRAREDIIQDIRLRREKEFYARRFFQPFEMVLDKIGIDTQLYEQQYYKIHRYGNLPGIFKERWRILQYLSTRQALLFMKLIPAIGALSKSLAQIARFMEIILDCPVSLREGVKTSSRLDPEDTAPLGKWPLGIRSVLGKTVESDQASLEITIGPIPPEQMRTFEIGAVNDRILKELIDLVVPFERYTAVNYQTEQAEAQFRISGVSHKTCLGMNTRL